MTPRQTPPRRPRNTGARRAQKGFVASAAQITFALVSTIVGATAISLEGAREQAAAQIVHAHASYLMKVGADLESALTRAAIDNGLSRGGDWHRHARSWGRRSSGCRRRTSIRGSNWSSPRPRWCSGKARSIGRASGSPRCSAALMTRPVRQQARPIDGLG